MHHTSVFNCICQNEEKSSKSSPFLSIPGFQIHHLDVIERLILLREEFYTVLKLPVEAKLLNLIKIKSID